MLSMPHGSQGSAQPANAFGDFCFIQGGDGKAQVAGVLAGSEAAVSQKGLHTVLCEDGRPVPLVGIPAKQFHPDQIPAFGFFPGSPCGIDVFPHGPESCLHAFAEDPVHVTEMQIVVSPFAEFVQSRLQGQGQTDLAEAPKSREALDTFPRGGDPYPQGGN
jgi:hypothetical protein